VAQIIHSGNDYLLAVKGHQPKLFEQLQTQFEHAQSPTVDRQTAQTRDRQTQRTVSILDCVAKLGPQWVGVQRII
jgi:hypothetical protein